MHKIFDESITSTNDEHQLPRILSTVNIAMTISKKDFKLSRDLTLNESNLHLNETQLLCNFFTVLKLRLALEITSTRNDIHRDEKVFDEIAIPLWIYCTLQWKHSYTANFNRFQCVIKQQIHVRLSCSLRCLHFSASVPIFSLIKFQVDC